MLSRSLFDCQSLTLNVMIEVSQFFSNSQLCHQVTNSLTHFQCLCLCSVVIVAIVIIAMNCSLFCILVIVVTVHMVQEDASREQITYGHFFYFHSKKYL